VGGGFARCLRFVFWDSAQRFGGHSGHGGQLIMNNEQLIMNNEAGDRKDNKDKEQLIMNNE